MTPLLWKGERATLSVLRVSEPAWLGAGLTVW